MRPPFMTFEAKQANPVLFLQAPHTSNYVPEDAGDPISPERLASHEGYDPGSIEMALNLYNQFSANAVLVCSNRSRLYVEHNRREPYCYPEGLSPEEIEHRRVEHYQPYIDQVDAIIESFLARRTFPVFLAVHTYTRKLDGYERKPFALFGNPDSVLIQSFAQNLHQRFHADDMWEFVQGLTEKVSVLNIMHPVDINKPYGYMPTDVHHAQYMFPTYAKKYDLPLWASLETRNDLVVLPQILQIVREALAATMKDQRLWATLEWASSEKLTPGLPRTAPFLETPVAPIPK